MTRTKYLLYIFTVIGVTAITLLIAILLNKPFDPGNIYREAVPATFVESDIPHVTLFRYEDLIPWLKKKRVVAIVFNFHLCGLDISPRYENQIITDPVKICDIVRNFLKIPRNKPEGVPGRFHMLYFVFEKKRGMIAPFTVDMKKQAFRSYDWNSPELFQIYTQVFGRTFLKELDRSIPEEDKLRMNRLIPASKQ